MSETEKKIYDFLKTGGTYDVYGICAGTGLSFSTSYAQCRIMFEKGLIKKFKTDHGKTRYIK